MRDRRMHSAAAGLAILIIGVGLSHAPVARASDIVDYEPYIPNGSVNTCVTCHLDMTGVQTNPFGLDVQNTKGGDTIPPEWSAVCDRDSDGDGQTNGQELGDPCCEFTHGGTPGRTSDISLPGDPTSMAADPTVGCSDEDDGGCSCAVVGGAVDRPAALLAALVSGLLLCGFRRRRR